LVPEVAECITDFAKGDFNDIIKGIEAFGVVLQHAPEDVKDCIH